MTSMAVTPTMQRKSHRYSPYIKSNHRHHQHGDAQTTSSVGRLATVDACSDNNNRCHTAVVTHQKTIKCERYIPTSLQTQLTPEDIKLLALHNITFLMAPKLGQGYYCQVRLAKQKYLDTKKQCVAVREVALKVVNLTTVSNSYRSKFLPREIGNLLSLRHPNIMRVYDAFHTHKHYFICCEHLGGGDLLDHVKSTGHVPYKKAQYWIAQLISALHYMHANEIVHRDIKLENVMLSADGRALKLVDFGFSSRVHYEGEDDDMALMSTYCGSKSYSCPEILLGTPYNGFKADVFSLGCLFYAMLLDRMPFLEQGNNNRQIVEQQRRGACQPDDKFGLPHALCQMIAKMMHFDAEQRYTMPELVACDLWYKSISNQQTTHC